MIPACLSSTPTVVILSEAKDLLFAASFNGFPDVIGLPS